MCGIFGVVASGSSQMTFEQVRKAVDALFRLSQTRGTEAAGIAVLREKKIDVLKEAKPAERFIRSAEYQRIFSEFGSAQQRVAAPLAIIGHSRMVTNGSEEHHYNNQPVIADGVVGIHNGIVVNDQSLWNSSLREFKRRYDVDSEVIFQLLRKYLRQESLQKSAQDTFTEIEGATSVASLFEELNCVLLATNNGSLYVGSRQNSPIVVFASERSILRKLFSMPGLQEIFKECEIEHLSPGRASIVYLEDLSQQAFSLADQLIAQLREPSNGAHREIIDIVTDDERKRGSSSKITAPEKTGSAARERLLQELFEQDKEYFKDFTRCSKCLLPETMPFIEFDNHGECNYCRNYKQISLYGSDNLHDLADRIRSKSGEHDCLVGISGGRDSCYGLHYLKEELKLHPVAFTYDWGMVTDLARRNISRLCGKLGIEHILVSADIPKKRSFVRKNVNAWLKRPNLGTIPLFMAGDKAYFYHANRLKNELGVNAIFLCENMLERTDFKMGYAGIKPANIDEDHVYTLSLVNKIKLFAYYGREYLLNPAYLNASIPDTLFAYACYYLIKREYYNLFKFIPWKEEEIIGTLRDQYDWELATDTSSTWRIGDGTAAFYNIIYHHASGFTENDTFRSNQIREGLLDRPTGLELAERENQFRFESFEWYCRTNRIDPDYALQTIANMPRAGLQSPRA